MTSAWPIDDITAGPSATQNVVPFTGSSKRILISETSLPWGDELRKRLSSLVHLEPGWDGYNAPPVRFENAFFALTMLERICNKETPMPYVVPGNSGDLQVEWHEEAGDVELHVAEPYVVEGWRLNESSGPEGEARRFRSDFTVAAEWLEEMMEPRSAPVAEAQ